MLQSVVHELERARGDHGGITSEELERARALARERLLAELDTTEGLASVLARMFRASRGIEDVERTIERLERLDADEVHAAAQRWIRPRRAAIVVMGDTQRIAFDVRFAGLGDVETRYARTRRRSH